MENKNFKYIKACICIFGCMSTLLILNTGATAADGYFYKLKVYHFKNQAQVSRVNRYLQEAYLPAMHKLGIKNIGVFTPVESDTLGKRLYVLIPFRSWAQLENEEQKLTADQNYLAAGKDYIDAPYNDMPYTRLETIVLSAFPKMPVPAVPVLTANKADRIYELRSYESPTEQYNVNKVRMFNDGDEVAIFKRLGFNAVFYSNVVAGSHMPNLMYMISFNSMADHDQRWKAFGDDPAWKSLKEKSEFQNNVSHIDVVFLHPAPYSDF
jgi:hypothetical protein